MSKLKLAIALLLLSVGTSNAWSQTISEDFNRRFDSLPQLRHIRDSINSLEPKYRDALQSLYAYMPLPDVTDYPVSFFLSNVESTFDALRTLPWGSLVPDAELQHFVLPLRVNNEVLDGHRPLFFAELKERVKGLSMKDAILEVNHWCHEKVTYQPSDARTHSPLQSVYTAIGRCGEESTFTVAALRSVGIPARQIYTPRWAHTDDNHAWVEAYADGQWYFLGACEPEAVLNLGWFNDPAARGMLMSCRVPGNYQGAEEVINRYDENSTDINTTHIYAPVGKTTVTTVHPDGTVATDAVVSFRIYNYAEFYPLASIAVDSSGKASLTTGRGDMLVWASDGKHFGFRKVRGGEDADVTVCLAYDADSKLAADLDIVPPAPASKAVTVEPALAEINKTRLAHEDSIRNAYTASRKLAPQDIVKLAQAINADTVLIKRLLSEAGANAPVVAAFLADHPDSPKAVALVEAIAEKDRRDIPRTMLEHHLKTIEIDSPRYADLILNPRVYNEGLTPYKGYFARKISEYDAARYRENPQLWVDWVAENIDATHRWYPATLRMSPISVYENRITDPTSRDIFFVAAARSIGIPARIDPVTEKPQYATAEGQWVDAKFSSEAAAAQSAQGELKLEFASTDNHLISDPKYYTHFTLSKIVDGEPQLLNFPEEATLLRDFAKPIKLDAGQYILTTGQRLADGSVLSHYDIFSILPDSATVVPFTLRRDDEAVSVIGALNAENIYFDKASGTAKSLISTTGRGYYILGLVALNDEPSNHALRDIAKLADEVAAWGGKVMILFADKETLGKFNPETLPALPDNAVLGADVDSRIADELLTEMKLTSTVKPIFVIADTFNRVVYVSQGYTIGLGETLTTILKKLN